MAAETGGSSYAALAAKVILLATQNACAPSLELQARLQFALRELAEVADALPDTREQCIPLQQPWMLDPRAVSGQRVVAVVKWKTDADQPSGWEVAQTTGSPSHTPPTFIACELEGMGIDAQSSAIICCSLRAARLGGMVTLIKCALRDGRAESLTVVGCKAERRLMFGVIESRIKQVRTHQPRKRWRIADLAESDTHRETIRQVGSLPRSSVNTVMAMCPDPHIGEHCVVELVGGEHGVEARVPDMAPSRAFVYVGVVTRILSDTTSGGGRQAEVATCGPVEVHVTSETHVLLPGDSAFAVPKQVVACSLAVASTARSSNPEGGISPADRAVLLGMIVRGAASSPTRSILLIPLPLPQSLLFLSLSSSNPSDSSVTGGSNEGHDSSDEDADGDRGSGPEGSGGQQGALRRGAGSGAGAGGCAHTLASWGGGAGAGAGAGRHASTSGGDTSAVRDPVADDVSSSDSDEPESLELYRKMLRSMTLSPAPAAHVKRHSDSIGLKTSVLSMFEAMQIAINAAKANRADQIREDEQQQSAAHLELVAQMVSKPSSSDRAVLPESDGELRDEQVHCVMTLSRSKARRQLVVLPTGSGKTAVAVNFCILRMQKTAQPAVILVQRTPLVAQMVHEINKYGRGNAQVFVYCGAMGQKSSGMDLSQALDYGTAIVVATAGYFLSHQSKRCFKDAHLPCVIVLDEVHNMHGDSDLAKLDKIMSHLPEGKRPPCIVGLTATPLPPLNLSKCSGTAESTKEFVEVNAFHVVSARTAPSSVDIEPMDLRTDPVTHACLLREAARFVDATGLSTLLPGVPGGASALIQALLCENKPARQCGQILIKHVKTLSAQLEVLMDGEPDCAYAAGIATQALHVVEAIVDAQETGLLGFLARTLEGSLQSRDRARRMSVAVRRSRHNQTEEGVAMLRKGISSGPALSSHRPTKGEHDASPPCTNVGHGGLPSAAQAMKPVPNASTGIDWSDRDDHDEDADDDADDDADAERVPFQFIEGAMHAMTAGSGIIDRVAEVLKAVDEGPAITRSPAWIIEAKLVEHFSRGVMHDAATRQQERAIVFVEQRLTARVLGGLLEHGELRRLGIKVGVLVGQGKRNSGSTDAVSSVRAHFAAAGTPSPDELGADQRIALATFTNTLREQQRSLRDFREGRVQVLVCTSVAEEGLDVPECNLVIVSKRVDTFHSLLQMRGRVRAKHGGKIILLYSRADLHRVHEAEAGMIAQTLELSKRPVPPSLRTHSRRAAKHSSTGSGAVSHDPVVSMDEAIKIVNGASSALQELAEWVRDRCDSSAHHAKLVADRSDPIEAKIRALKALSNASSRARSSSESPRPSHVSRKGSIRAPNPDDRISSFLAMFWGVGEDFLSNKANGSTAEERFTALAQRINTQRVA